MLCGVPSEFQIKHERSQYKKLVEIVNIYIYYVLA